MATDDIDGMFEPLDEDKMCTWKDCPQRDTPHKAKDHFPEGRMESNLEYQVRRIDEARKEELAEELATVEPVKMQRTPLYAEELDAILDGKVEPVLVPVPTYSAKEKGGRKKRNRDYWDIPKERALVKKESTVIHTATSTDSRPKCVISCRGEREAETRVEKILEIDPRMEIEVIINRKLAYRVTQEGRKKA